ncbi:MAG: helix-turn-helix domain-containing protein [Candidatus Hodarchaeales archaeon]
MKSSVLEQLGLSSQEEKCYLTLLSTGHLTIGEISNRLNIPYLALEQTISSLLHRGLISEITGLAELKFVAHYPFEGVEISLSDKINHISKLSEELDNYIEHKIQNIKDDIDRLAKPTVERRLEGTKKDLSITHTSFNSVIEEGKTKVTRDIDNSKLLFQGRVDLLSNEFNKESKQLMANLEEDIIDSIKNSVLSLEQMINSLGIRIRDHAGSIKYFEEEFQESLVESVNNAVKKPVESVISCSNGAIQQINTHTGSIHDLTLKLSQLLEKIQTGFSEQKKALDSSLEELFAKKNQISSLYGEKAATTLNMIDDSKNRFNERYQQNTNSVLNRHGSTARKQLEKFTGETDRLVEDSRSIASESLNNLLVELEKTFSAIEGSMKEFLEKELERVAGPEIVKERRWLIFTRTIDRSEEYDKIRKRIQKVIDRQKDLLIVLLKGFLEKETGFMGSIIDSIKSTADNAAEEINKATAEGEESVRTLINEFDSFGRVVKLIENMKDELILFSSKIVSLSENYVLAGENNAYANGIEEYRQELVKLAETIDHSREKAVEIIKNTERSILSDFEAFQRQISELSFRELERVKTTVQTIIDKVNASIVETNTNTREEGDKLRTALQNHMKDILSSNETIRESFATSMKDAIESAQTVLNESIENFSSFTLHKFEEMGKTLLEGMEDSKKLLYTDMDNNIATVKNGMKDFSNKFKTQANALNSALKDQEIAVSELRDYISSSDAPDVDTAYIIGKKAVLTYIEAMIQRIKTSMTLVIPDPADIPFDALLSCKPRFRLNIISDFDLIKNTDELVKLVSSRDTVKLRQLRKGEGSKAREMYTQELSAYLSCSRDGEEVIVASMSSGEDYIPGIDLPKDENKPEEMTAVVSKNPALLSVLRIVAGGLLTKDSDEITLADIQK